MGSKPCSPLCHLFAIAISFLLAKSVASEEENPLKSCDLFKGSWVFDDSYPLYDASTQCPFANIGLDCLKYGRRDKMYLKYRWQPLGCNIPRFDGKVFLEKMRGKKIMFVGDSLSSNQWQSLGCMLHSSALPSSNFTLETRGLITTLSFPEYGVSVMFMKNGFLVSLVNRTLKLDTLRGSDLWIGVDVLIFNSYHWWTHTGRLQTWDNYQIGDKIIPDMDRMVAYKIALTTWANWVDSKIDPTKVSVFYQGISAVHYNGSEWEQPSKNCVGQTTPVEGGAYGGGTPAGDAAVRSVLSNMKKGVYFLDILLQSQLRKDGHPSVYVRGGVDCSHWCIAGVPDTWNQLLYTILLHT
ncbi:protein trichome birefringence-like 42 [Henckelia pumila]|uniref:protein trichome birefringence-like 42 n=1 Tax=Henckelia pumila TaxID=405737 RepID=UPI003C6E7736